MDQFRIPCVIMRAGTSKGIFLKENSKTTSIKLIVMIKI